MADDKYKVEEVIAAIKGSAGIKATIQRKLGCSRNTVDNYLKRYATAQAAYDEEVESIGDAAESVIIGAIRNKDVDTAKWYATKKLRARGYGDVSKTEISGNVDLNVVKGYIGITPDDWDADKS